MTHNRQRMNGNILLTDVLGHLTAVEMKYAPEILHFSGDLELLKSDRRVSVVGSRKASDAGKKRAEVITKALISHGIVVVSGLAEGIDTVAHTTAINCGGKTITVLGTPLTKPYPKSNTELLLKIATNHLAISQFPDGYPVQKKNFPLRNRTMALISDATIIVEASEKSGTQHQGWEALRLGRKVYLMENLLKDDTLSWPKQMLSYGAETLTRENMDDLIWNIPHLTTSRDLAF